MIYETKEISSELLSGLKPNNYTRRIKSHFAAYGTGYDFLHFYAVEESAQIAQLLPGQGNPLLHGVLSVRLVPPFPQIVPGRRSGERYQIQLKGQGNASRWCRKTPLCLSCS